MMKKITWIVLLAASILGTSSCDDYLDIKPKGFTIPELYEDYALLMEYQSIYTMSNSGMTNLLSDDIQLGDKSDDNSTRYASQSVEEQNAYSFVSGQIYPKGTTDRNWTGHYSNIYTLNVVINNVLKSKGGTEEKRQLLRSEALFRRAYEYFNLVNIYGKHYAASSANKDYGVPIILDEDINQGKPTRQSVAKVYDQIFMDLNEAEKHLPVKARRMFYPSKSAVHFLKARAYLYMAEYEKALQEANEVLKENSSLINFNDYTIIPNLTWGRCVLKSNAQEVFPENEKCPENVLIYFNTNSDYASILLSKETTDLYSKDLAVGATDQRFTFNFAKDRFNRGKKPVLCPGKTIYCSFINYNVSGFRTAEMILTAAECEARVGDKDRAMSLVNQLRDKRIEKNVHLTAQDKEQALRYVLDERRREFALISNFRLFDLKRLNMDDRFKKDVTHTADGQQWTLPANDNRYILPIPNTVLDFNPEMPQYER